MKVGILGTGFSAHHASIYRRMEGVEIVKIFGRNEEKLERIRSDWGHPTTRSIAEVVCDPAIDLIDVCLPTNLHAHYVLEALKNGKHVFCETPLSYSMSEVEAMRVAEKRYGRRVFVDLFAKFVPEIQYAREAIDSGMYGALKTFTVARKTPPIWGSLGLDSIVTNLMLHDLDTAVWLLGVPKEMRATGVSLGIDKANVRVIMHCGDAIAEVEASSMMPMGFPFTVSYEAVFEKGALQYTEISTKDSASGTLIEFTSEGQRKLMLAPADPYEQAIRHVIGCIRDDRPTIVGIDDAARALSIAFEATQMVFPAE